MSAPGCCRRRPPGEGARSDRPASAVYSNVVLDSLQQRRVHCGCLLLLDFAGTRAPEHQLHLAGVAAPGRQQWVLRDARRLVLATRHRPRPGPDRRGHPIPQHRRRVHQEEVDVPALSDGFEHLEIAGRQPGESEQRKSGRELQEIGSCPQPLAGLAQALGRARCPDALTQEAPELDLPGRLVELRRAGGPALQHVGSMHRIAVEEVRHMPDAREPPGSVFLGGGLLDVLGQWRQPGLVEMVLDDLNERPHRPLRHPGVQVRISVECSRQRVRDQRAWKREFDVGADAVLSSVAGAQMRRQLLRQPPLDTPRRHRDHLGSHGVPERIGQKSGEHPDEDIGPLGSVNVQHPGRVRRRCSRATDPANPLLGGPGAAYAVPVLAPLSGRATMVGCVNSSSGSSG